MNMIEMKTADLIGPALDWAVAKAVDLPVEIASECCGCGVQSGYESPPECCGEPVYGVFWKEGRRYQPSEREGDASSCRIIVANRFGDVVQVPAELVTP
ncbi:hypothetical protein DN824_21940 [Stutzerimonas nosocomialis]|uniref:hypothetical protein n=1 Tax=Stutzerimonas nosocomialis TaxID=1056496 RepID=UPI0011086AAD|nr:hypothetical protein [Stutzerimonas nosocomialis]TLX52772.1 hypothetical protein DN824_21940 [Stutzerimonas nosocomialis]